MCISRATVSAVSCLVVPAFICIDLLISRVLKINDDDDDIATYAIACSHITGIYCASLQRALLAPEILSESFLKCRYFTALLTYPK